MEHMSTCETAKCTRPRTSQRRSLKIYTGTWRNCKKHVAAYVSEGSIKIYKGHVAELQKKHIAAYVSEVFTKNLYGHVAELVYAYVSEAYGETLGSSSLPVPTMSPRMRARKKHRPHGLCFFRVQEGLIDARKDHHVHSPPLSRAYQSTRRVANMTPARTTKRSIVPKRSA